MIKSGLTSASHSSIGTSKFGIDHGVYSCLQVRSLRKIYSSKYLHHDQINKSKGIKSLCGITTLHNANDLCNERKLHHQENQSDYTISRNIRPIGKL